MAYYRTYLQYPKEAMLVKLRTADRLIWWYLRSETKMYIRRMPHPGYAYQVNCLRSWFDLEVGKVELNVQALRLRLAADKLLGKQQLASRLVQAEIHLSLLQSWLELVFEQHVDHGKPNKRLPVTQLNKVRTWWGMPTLPSYR